jgi:hypothetical protein
MLHPTIIKEFEGKLVDLTTTKRDFTGTLKYDVSRNVVIIDPIDKWVANRYGIAFIDAASVIAIREFKLRDLRSSEAEDGDGDDCDSDRKG